MQAELGSNQNVSFGQWVKQRRKWLDLTQTQLAAQLGCAVITLQKIEANSLRPSGKIARRLAEALQIAEAERAHFVELARTSVLPRHKTSPAEADPAPVNSLRNSGLFGRDEMVDQLAWLLREPNTRVLTLVGPPGVGKTRLARAVSEQLRAESIFVDGIVVAWLADVQAAGMVLPTLCRALGLGELPHNDPLDQLQHALVGKHLLLLLDNFEHVLATAPYIEALVSVTQSRVLVTSRSPLKIASEQSITVDPLRLPNLALEATVQQLSQNAAVGLFVERAKQALPDFALSTANAATIAEICIRLDGLPLAIELAAAQCRYFSPMALLERLQQRMPLLESRNPQLPARQRRLQDAIEWSYQQLDPMQQQLFNRLSIFVGGWTIEAAETVAASLSPSASSNAMHVLSGLEHLLDNSLIVQRSTLQGTPRFGMLETLREFGLTKLHASDDDERMAQAHAHYYLSVAKTNEMQMLSPRQAEVLDLLDTEYQNFRAALSWALQHGDEMARELSGRLYFFWQLRSYSREGCTWLRKALQLNLPIESADQKINQARALYGLGCLAFLLSDYAEAKPAFEQALTLRRELGDIRSQATLLNSLGQIADQQGQLAEAEQLWQDGYALAKSIDDKPRMTATVANLGELAYKRGNYALAGQLHAEALALARSTGSKYNIALQLHESGKVALKMGDPARARLLHEEALVHAREIGDRHSIAVILMGLGEVAEALDDLSQAFRFYSDALNLRREIDHRWGIGASLASLGHLSAMQGERGRALALLNEALEILIDLGDHLMAATVRTWLTEAQTMVAL